MNENKRLFRRDFLNFFTKTMFALAGLLGLGGLLRFFSFQPDTGRQTEFNLGDLSSFPLGSYTFRPDIPAVIFNHAGEFIAYSLVCTHLGCTVEQDGGNLSCPCHGSRFDRDGKVIQGPAQRALKRLRIEILDDNTLMLFTGGS